MSKGNKQIIIYLFLSCMLFVFFASESSYLYQNIIVPYIKYETLNIHLLLTFITIVVVVFTNKKQKVVLDMVCLFLLARVCTSIMPALTIYEATKTLGRVTVPIIALLSYFIGRQYRGSINAVVKVNMIFVLIISIQTIYTVINIPQTVGVLYVLYVKIPLASSNLIAAYIIPCIFMTLKGYHGKWYIKYFVIIISSVAVILSTSMGAILISVVMLIIYVIFLNNKIEKKFKIHIILLFVIGTFIILLFLISNNNESLSDLTHQRSDQIIRDIKLWSDHIILGNGMVYKGRDAGSHNILVDLLVQNGVVGFALYIVPLVIIFKKLFSNKSNKCLCFGMYLLAAFLHSMIETSYFNYSSDMLFWFMAGVAISQNHHENKEKKLEMGNLIETDYKSLNSKP